MVSLRAAAIIRRSCRHSVRASKRTGGDVLSVTERVSAINLFGRELRRNPNDPQDTDYTGYDFWLTKLNQSNGNFILAEMIKAFLSSIE